MSLQVERISVWDDGTETYNIGPGMLKVADRYTRITVPRGNIDRVDCPTRPIDYNILASNSDGVVYEGKIKLISLNVSSMRPERTMKCKPAERADD